MAGRRLSVAPRDPTAEPICLLTKEWAAQRRVPVDALLDQALAEDLRADGIEYHLTAGSETWERVATFIEEEGECCPFLAFEAIEGDDDIVLSIIQPRKDA